CAQRTDHPRGQRAGKQGTLTENGPDLATATVGRKPGRGGKAVTYILLIIGAIAFLFPFYYMVVGSLQEEPNTTVAGAFPNPANLTFAHYVAINSRLDLGQSLINSGIFTGGVLLGTIVFGVLAGYALALLHFRGRGALFGSIVVAQGVPFQPLI